VTPAGPPKSNNLMMVMAVVKQALLYATNAVAADERHDYVTAHTNYQQAVEIIHAELARSPEVKALVPKIQVYQRRIEMIEQTNPYLIKRDEIPQDNFIFKEISFVKQLPEAPCEECFRPYWMMRTLLSTITTGGFLTPKLYVPKIVWLQRDVKISSVQAKLAACYPVIESLQKLQMINFEEIGPEIAVFAEKCDIIQNTLSQHLSYINSKTKYEAAQPSPAWEKLGKGMKTMINKGASVLTSASPKELQFYIYALQCIFKESQFLEAWLANPSIRAMDQMKTIGDFMRDVVCAFAVKDLGIMLDKYTQKAFSQVAKS